MKKVHLDGKETDKKDAATLSDKELKRIAGGGDKCYPNRWYCMECDAHTRWSEHDYIIDWEKDIHSQQTGHTHFYRICKWVGDSYDPYEED